MTYIRYTQRNLHYFKKENFFIKAEKIQNSFNKKVNFPGKNGVMVQTYNTFIVNGYKVEFNDKATFKLTSQSQEVALDAILCEKGKILLTVLGTTRVFTDTTEYPMGHY